MTADSWAAAQPVVASETNAPAVQEPATQEPATQKPAAAKQEPAAAKMPAKKEARKDLKEVDRETFNRTVGAGVKFIMAHQDEDGSFSKQLGPAVTSMCLAALLDNGIPLSNPAIQKGLKFVESNVRNDGGIYAKGSGLKNYETSVAVMCLIRANENDKYDKTIQDAVGFLKGIQWDEGEGYEKTSDFYGGQGYGKHKRPDASNTSFYMDALEEFGEDANSAAIQKAQAFMARCQNLNSPHNSAEFTQKTTAEDSGGYIYSPVGKGESKAGETPEGGLRSYASMTYAGLKSMLYAGVDKDDMRVKAAMDWIGRHYSLESNPGMGAQGLYYYYHVFAKTLQFNGQRMIIDKDGKAHNWRADLVEELATRQRTDGSWTNEADRWFEGDPNLVTSYSLLALSYCHPDKDKDAEPMKKK